MTTASATLPMTREVTLTRIIDAPRALVWAAWTEPKHMAQWWGPHQFTNPVCEMDVRPGGKMLIHMKAPDGTVYPMPAIFTEVVKPRAPALHGLRRRSGRHEVSGIRYDRDLRGAGRPAPSSP